MPNCFMIRSSPALVMLARLKWLIKQRAMSSARMRQRTEVGCARSESAGAVIGRSSKHQAPNSKEAPSPKNQLARVEGAFEVWPLKFLWSLEFFIVRTPRRDIF